MSNNSSSSCCDIKQFSITVKIIFSTWYGLAGLGAIIGNGLVLWLIFKHRSLRTVPNLFLTSLAAADFLVGLVIDPVWISIRCVLYNNTSTYAQAYSKVISYLWIHTTVATTFNLCCVTLDRHIAIFYPLRYEDIVTNKRCYLLIATVWFMSLALPCSRFFIKDHEMLPALWLSFAIITMLIPMIIIIFCSIRNFKAAAAQSKQIISVVSLQIQDASKSGKKNFKAAKTVSIVVGLFVVCWLPTLVTSFVHHFTKTESYDLVAILLWTVADAVAFTSSAINPWVYCFRNREFYEVLTRAFPFLRRQNPVMTYSNLRSTNMELTEYHTSNPKL